MESGMKEKDIKAILSNEVLKHTDNYKLFVRKRDTLTPMVYEAEFAIVVDESSSEDIFLDLIKLRLDNRLNISKLNSGFLVDDNRIKDMIVVGVKLYG